MEGLGGLASNFDDIRVFMFFYWIEGFFIAYTGLNLLGIRLNLKKVIPVGLLHGMGVFVVRGIYNIFNIPFGTHTIILTLLMAFLITRFGKIRWGIAVTAALLGIVLLTIGEMVTMPFFYKMMNMPIEEIWANPWTHILAGYVGDLLIILTALFTTVTGFSLLNLRD